MELRAFAEQVLFATTLEEKLRCPEAITDAAPGAACAAPELPGRPDGLRFKASGSGGADFPGLHRLDQERERGRLLHFFANHELLATELMALVLLRFPEAPAAFRRGVLRTLQEEQCHTRLYLRRMQECGVQFGELPVSGYFWRAVSRMESPLDYVAGLSLTFEQANLDFARRFARGFAEAGDAATAALLERIYQDEIGHVAYGLKWFRRWKDPRHGDWEAYRRQLKYPLSPQRAKSAPLNVEGRRDAGLDAAFIDELKVYAQSKGRTPGVFIFNPFAEGFIAQGNSFTPGKPQAQLAADLADLPQYLCRQDDIVLVPKRPSVGFLAGIHDAGFALPEFVELDRGTGTPPGSLAQRKLGRLQPWAWGPDSVELLAPLFASVTGEKRPATQCFNDGIARLYSKAWSAALLGEFLRQHDSSGNGCIPLCTGAEAGVAVDTLDAALDVIAAIRRGGHHNVVVKQALGLAGRNAIRLWEPVLLETHRRWMARVLENRRQLVVEPWLERELDFSAQWEMTPRGLQFIGYAGLINDRRGQYQANWAEPGHPRRLPAPVAALLGRAGDVPIRLHQLYAELQGHLEPKLRHAGYLGPVGLDAFVYRADDGGCRLKPLVEINPRYTMGRLTVELMKQACPGSHGLFRLVSRAQARAEGFDDFVAYARSRVESHPLRLEGEPAPRIREGVLCLNDPARARACLAVFRVRPEPFPPAALRSGACG